MGWTFTRGATKAELVRDLLEGALTRDHELLEDVLWMVVEFDRQKVIICCLLQQGGDGWGYKDMHESMHPYRYDCPLRLLEMAPVCSERWRAAVRAHHAGREK